RSRTVDDYRRLVQRWVESPPPGFPALGRVRMHELTHRNLDALYAAMLPATTAGQVARLNGLLAQAFEEAVRKDYLGRNPADKASVPQPEQNEVAYEDAVSQTMDRVQLARFLDAAREVERDRPFSALWHVLALAGLRPGEAFALRWPDVVEANG